MAAGTPGLGMFGAIGSGLSIFGAISSGIGSFYSAKNTKASLTFQAEIADNNARIAELGAQSELLRGQREEQRVRLQTSALKGRQRATLAASGVDLGSQSAVNILSTTDVMGEIDANTVAANAVQAAWGYRTQAQNLKNEALTKRTTARGINPAMAAATTLIGGAGNVAQSWYALNKAGALRSDVRAANKTDDPIQSLGASRGWWGG